MRILDRPVLIRVIRRQRRKPGSPRKTVILEELAAAGYIPSQLLRALTRHGERTVNDLVSLSRREFAAIPRIGRVGREQLRRLLIDQGCSVAHLEEKPPAVI